MPGSGLLILGNDDVSHCRLMTYSLLIDDTRNLYLRRVILRFSSTVVQPVGPVRPGWRDVGIPHQPQQRGNGDRGQPGAGVSEPSHPRSGTGIFSAAALPGVVQSQGRAADPATTFGQFSGLEFDYPQVPVS